MFYALAALILSTPTVIENTRVEVGDGTALTNATVIIDAGKITYVGNEPPVTNPAKVINGLGKILTPGFIETLSTIGLSEVGMEESTNNYYLEGPKSNATPAFHVGPAFNPKSVRIPIARAEGITSVIARPVGQLIHGTGIWVELDAKLYGMGKTLDTPIAMYGAVGARAAGAYGGSKAKLWSSLNNMINDSRFYVKNFRDFERNASRTLALDEEQLAALIPVTEGKMPLVLAANQASDILQTIRFCKRHKIKLVLSGGAESWMVSKALTNNDIPVILTPSHQYPTSFEKLFSHDDLASRLLNAGVKVIISTGNSMQNIRRLRQEAGRAVAMGLEYAQAIKAITLAPALAFGKDKELGSVTTGKRANLVLWSADPLELDTVIEHLWIDGETQSLETRQTKLAKKYLKP
jgi:imidazolonepropionase-like amidohydrolase